MRALLLVAAILSVAGCRPPVKSTAGSAVGSKMLTMSDGAPIWISSPTLANYCHLRYGAPHATSDSIEVEVAGRSVYITIERSKGSATLQCAGITYGPLPAGRIWKLDFTATGDLTIVSASLPAATVSPTSLPAPTPSK